MIDENYNGIVEDPRSDYKKSLDYKHEDLTMGDVVLTWKEYDETKVKSFPIQNQDGSLSCVAQGTSKILAMHEVLEGSAYKQLCPKFIYDRRQNYPGGGMWLPNALEIACKMGSCEETIIPCDDKGEEFMNDRSSEPTEAAKNALQYKGKLYFEITDRSIDNVAKVLEQGYGVLAGFRFDYNEWTDVPYLDPNSKKTVGHGIAFVDYVILNGQKVLVMEDSWGPHYGKGGRRFITEEFLNARCFYAGYITSLPNYQFTKTLQYKSYGLDVRMLQKFLNKQGYILIVDGKFGRLTELAVVNFQRKHNLKTDGVVGPKTNAVINSL